MMSNSKQRSTDKIKNNLFIPKEELTENFSKLEYEKKQRIMLCVTKRMDNPIITDKELINFITAGCGGVCPTVPKSTAYRDLVIINSVTGNIKLASKEWLRYMLIEVNKEEILRVKGKDAKAVAALSKVIIEAGGLNKDDPENIFDQMIPFDPIISDDASILGQDIALIDNVEEKRKEFRKLFRKAEKDAIIEEDE